MAERSFSGAKLRIARNFHDLTQIELATRLACDQSLIGHLERGQKQPSELVLNALCDALGFDPSFFEADPIVEFRDEECNFRRRKTTTASTRASALSRGTLFAQLVSHLEETLDLPVDSIPQCKVLIEAPTAAAERAAEMCRMHWGLGLDRPIENVCRAIEAHGAVITRIETGGTKVDAFSRAGERHIVVLTTDKGSASRCRFDGGHELGHLVMHRGQPTGTPAAEAQADRFASAFLLPRAGFMREFPRASRVDWDRVLDIKQHWGASAAAIVRRAHDLDLIDALAYQQAYKYMAWKRWSKVGEPFEPEVEQPETVRFACEALHESFGVTAASLAADLGWRLPILERVVSLSIPAEVPEPERSEVIMLDSKRARN